DLLVGACSSSTRTRAAPTTGRPSTPIAASFSPAIPAPDPPSRSRRCSAWATATSPTSMGASTPGSPRASRWSGRHDRTRPPRYGPSFRRNLGPIDRRSISGAPSMTHAPGFRPRHRSTQDTPWLARLWVAFIATMLVASFFSALIEPVSAAPDTADAAQTAPEQGDPQPLDSDNDGLSDQDEANLGTDPNNPDTDGDGMPDGQDPDPLNPPAPDTDRAAKPAATDIAHHTEPRKRDADGDGLVDGHDPDPPSPQGPDTG